MPIKTLTLKNFGPYQGAEIEFHPQGNVFVGPNWSGKSHLRDAISLALSGTCIGYENGQGLAGLRSNVNPKEPWSIGFTLVNCNGEELDIFRTDSGGPRSTVQGTVSVATGVLGPVARACVYGSEFLRLEPKDRQKFLMELIPRDDIETPQDLRDEIVRLLANVPPARVDVARLDSYLATATKTRTEIGREARAVGEIAVPAPPEALEGVAEMTLAELDAQRLQINGRLAEIQSQIRAALSKQAPSVEDLGPLQRNLEMHRSRLEAARKEVAGLPSDSDLTAEERTVAAQLSAAEAENEHIAETLAKHKSAIDAALLRLDIAETALRALLHDDAGTCPTCDTKLTAAKRQAVKKAREEAKASAEAALSKARNAMAEISDPLVLSGIKAQLAAVSEKRKLRAAVLIGAAQAEEEVAQSEKRLAEGRARVENTPPADEGEGEVDGLTARLTAGQEIRDTLAEYIGARRQAEEAAGKKAVLEARYKDLTALIEALGPEGIRKTIGAGGIHQFHEKMNGWIGWCFTADLRPALDMTGDPEVVKADGSKVTTGRLSDSECILFDTALALAVAETTGLRMVAIDRFEAMDPTTRDTVFSLLVASGFQFFVFGVQTSDAYPEAAAGLNADGGDIRYFVVSKDEAGSHVEAPEMSTP